MRCDDDGCMEPNGPHGSEYGDGYFGTWLGTGVSSREDGMLDDYTSFGYGYSPHDGQEMEVVAMFNPWPADFRALVMYARILGC